MRHLVVSPAKLEAENRKQVFSLEQDLAFKAITHVDRMAERCLLDHIVNPRRQNQPEILDSSQTALETRGGLENQKQCTDRFYLTSGYPLGSRKVSGMPQSGGNPNACCSVCSDGGVGAVAYSVIARLLTLEVIGVAVPSVIVA